MKALTFNEVVKAWTAPLDRKLDEEPESRQRHLHLTDHALKLLTRGQPVSAEQLAASAELPLEIVQAALRQMWEQGGEFDANGNLVGLALTLNPTHHRFRIKDQELYTWCALDAIFLPGLLGETAEVESSCPITGETIRLTVTPYGVARYNPPDIVLSIAVPGVSCNREAPSDKEDRATRAREGCHQMHFFSSRVAAEAWVKDYPGAAIFTVEEAWRLAKLNWIDRRKAAVLLAGLTNQPVSCCC